MFRTGCITTCTAWSVGKPRFSVSGSGRRGGKRVVLVQKEQNKVSQLLWNKSLPSKESININIFGYTFYMGLRAMLQLIFNDNTQCSHVCLLGDDGLLRLSMSLAISCSEIIYFFLFLATSSVKNVKAICRCSCWEEHLPNIYNHFEKCE